MIEHPPLADGLDDEIFAVPNAIYRSPSPVRSAASHRTGARRP
jgi:hypothetical protein